VYRGQENAYFSYPHLDHLRESATTLSGLAFMADLNRVQVAVAGAVDMARGELVSGEYFGVLGVRPHAGRLLLPADDRPDGAVAVISHGFWQRRFAADPAAVGRSMTVNGVPVTIVGVTPREFFGVTVGSTIDVRLPLRLRDRLQPGRAFWEEPSVTWLTTLGRLRAGVEPGQAAAELTPLFRLSRWSEALLAGQVALCVTLLFGAGLFVRSVRNALATEGGYQRADVLMFSADPSLKAEDSLLRERLLARTSTLFGVVAMLLAGVGLYGSASFAVARRGREIGLRMALGADRSRVVRMTLRQSLAPVAVGALIGLPAAYLTMRVARSLLFGIAPHDPSTMCGAVALLVAVAAAASYLPARRAARVEPMVALRAE
jgi:ABC-type antimicrobial peptide transport system permease subunit